MNRNGIKPYCPALEWISKHAEKTPRLNNRARFYLDDSLFIINSNDECFIEAALKRLQSYRVESPGHAKVHETIFNVTCLDSVTEIDLPEDWRQCRGTGVGSVYMSPYQRESTKLEHLIWGEQECLYRPSDILASFNRIAPVEVLIAKSKRSKNPSDYQATISSDILLDLIQAMYARLNNFFTFHAAYMGLEDKGVLIAGNSGCGKTTTAATLLHSGFTMFSDDMTLIRSGNNGVLQATGWLMPPRFIGIAAPSLDAIEETIIPKKKRNHQVKMKIKPLPDQPGKPIFDLEVKKAITLPDSISFKANGAWIEPAAIVFLEQRDDGARNHEMLFMDSKNAMIRIMDLALDPTIASRRESMFDIALDLIKRCNIYHLKLGTDIHSLPKLFKKILNGVESCL
jgi:hypothetical protein